MFFWNVKVKYVYFSIFLQAQLVSACSERELNEDTKYTTVCSHCILTTRIKVNLFHVSWLKETFSMPREGFICSAVLLIHGDLTLCLAQRHAI